VRDIPLPPSVNHNLTTPTTRYGKLRFGVNDLVVLAFPVYEGRVPVIAIELFEQLHGEQTPAILVAVYGNRAYEGALLDLDKLSLHGPR
jgi:hypothetical protein